MEHRAIVEAYIARVGVADADGLAELFNDDAVVHMPIRDEPYVGRDAIHAFYVDLFARTQRIAPDVHALAVDGDVGMFEFTLSMRLPDGSRHVAPSVDVFHFADGRIQRLRAYTEGAPLRGALDMG